MGAIDLRRQGTNNSKRKIGVCTVNVQPALVTVAEGFATAATIAAADIMTVATLPDNSIVVGAEIQVITGLTTGTQTVSIEVGGVEVMAAVALGTADNVTKGTTTKKKVAGDVVLTTAEADLVDGEFQVLISYIEPDLTDEALTVS